VIWILVQLALYVNAVIYSMCVWLTLAGRLFGFTLPLWLRKIRHVTWYGFGPYFLLRVVQDSSGHHYWRVLFDLVVLIGWWLSRKDDDDERKRLGEKIRARVTNLGHRLAVNPA
jgi:uncharacterized membrane protein